MLEDGDVDRIAYPSLRNIITLNSRADCRLDGFPMRTTASHVALAMLKCLLNI